MTIHWKTVEQYFTVVLFGFSICNFRAFINLGILTVRSERVYSSHERSRLLCTTLNVDTIKAQKLVSKVAL